MRGMQPTKVEPTKKDEDEGYVIDVYHPDPAAKEEDLFRYDV